MYIMDLVGEFQLVEYPRRRKEHHCLSGNTNLVNYYSLYYNIVRMSNKQSNKQTQSVKVVVNNKLSCNPCEKKKKKPKRKQQQPGQPEREASPLAQPINEFPALNTELNSRYPQGGIAPMAVRNTVYIPNAAQITPEGMQYPIPSYFDRQYTNLTRTMEDFRDSMMKEIADVRQTISIRPPMMTNDTQTDFPQSSMDTQTDENLYDNALFGTLSRRNTVDEENEPVASTSRTPVKQLKQIFEPNVQNSPTTPTPTPIKNLYSKLSNMNTGTETDNVMSSRKQLEKERRIHFTSEKFTDEDIAKLYNEYINKFDIKKRGGRAKKRLTQINNILAFEKMHGRLSP